MKNIQEKLVVAVVGYEIDLRNLAWRREEEDDKLDTLTVSSLDA